MHPALTRWDTKFSYGYRSQWKDSPDYCVSRIESFHYGHGKMGFSVTIKNPRGNFRYVDYYESTHAVRAWADYTSGITERLSSFGMITR
jgi:hypothetical protein